MSHELVQNVTRINSIALFEKKYRAIKFQQMYRPLFKKVSHRFILSYFCLFSLLGSYFQYVTDVCMFGVNRRSLQHFISEPPKWWGYGLSTI